MASVTREIAGHTFTVAPFTGERSDAAAREIMVTLGAITQNHAGAPADIAKRAADHVGIMRLAEALIDPDFVGLTPAGSEIAQPATPGAVAKLLPPGLLLPLLAWIAQQQYLPGAAE